MTSENILLLLMSTFHLALNKRFMSLLGYLQICQINAVVNFRL